MTSAPDAHAAIRRAAIGDAQAIAAVLRASITELCIVDHAGGDALYDWLRNKTPANVEAWIRNPANIMLVAELERAVASVGCLRSDGWIFLNYVSPRFRFQGVSKVMLRALESCARELGIEVVALESTRTAHRFYLAEGYADAAPVTAKHGLPVLPMRKTLDATG